MVPSKSGLIVLGGISLFGLFAYDQPLVYSLQQDKFTNLRQLWLHSSVEEGLVSAAELGRVRVVKRMLSNGAPVESRKGRWTALGRAVMFGQDAVVEVLLDAGANVNDPNPSIGSAVYLAVAGRRESVLRTLMARGADPNLTPEWGLTPLMVAAVQGNVAMVKLLLAGGADAKRKGEGGVTALDLANAEQHSDAAQVISDWLKQ